jgi:hypothetical protein
VLPVKGEAKEAGHLLRGTFTMNGGTISGNPAPIYGGGVYAAGADIPNGFPAGVFTKEGGAETNKLDGTVLKNSAAASHAVYVENGSKERSATAGRGFLEQRQTQRRRRRVGLRKEEKRREGAGQFADYLLRDGGIPAVTDTGKLRMVFMGRDCAIRMV